MRAQISKIRNEKRSYNQHEQNKKNNKLDNLGEMDKFLELHNLLRLNHEEIENLNRPYTTNNIEPIV